MSLLPLLLELADSEPTNSFGFGIFPDDMRYLRHSTYHPSLCGVYNRPWVLKNHSANDRRSKSLAQTGKDGFQVSMDVEHFAPNEISVKTVDNTIVVEGKHEEKEDQHGQIYRHFIRRYELPKEYDVKDVVSSLSSDGVLTIKAPPPAKSIEAKNERVIQIQQTGPAHLSVKGNSKEAAPAEEKMAD